MEENMKKNVWKILFISFIVLLGVSFTTFVILTTINCINTYNDEFTSFPWYTPPSGRTARRRRCPAHKRGGAFCAGPPTGGSG